MRFSGLIFISLVGTAILGCVGVPKNQSIYRISYDQFEDFSIGLLSSSLLERYGKPDLIEKSEEFPSLEIWRYAFPGRKTARAMFWVDMESKVVAGKSFRFSDEPEFAKLDKFIKVHGRSEFNIERPAQVGHHPPDEIYYSNETIGLYFTVSDARQMVTRVTWLNPQIRIPASK